MTSDPQNAQVAEHDTRIIRSFRESGLFYRRFLEAAKEGILIMDFDTGCIKDVNPFLFNLLGISRHEMLGKQLGELTPFINLEIKKSSGSN